MDKVRTSSASSRKAVIALALVGMLVAGMGVTNVDAGASPVTLQTNKTTADIMTDDGTGNNFVEVTLTLTNTDTTDFTTMEVFLVASWSPEAWTTEFTDSSGEELEDDTVAMNKGGSATVKLIVYCDGTCEAGDVSTVTVIGKSDPRWYNGGTDSGSDSSRTDITPASGSTNTTGSVAITLTARTSYGFTVDCDTVSDSGDNQFFQGNTYLWGYDLENSGWNTDTYTFKTEVTSDAGYETGFWTVLPGLTSKELTGQSDDSASAVHTAEASISITPATDARPGVYNIQLTVTSTGGAPPDACDFDVVVPEPDLEIKDSDISFSHTGAWINTRGDSQRVTITAKVRNNGGFADQAGVTATDVEVKFYVDGSPLGSVQTIESLAYGAETTVSVYWNPARPHDGDEVGIPIRVIVDPSDNIAETDTDNNEGSTTFKVVRTKASNPSFYLGFLSLTAAVGAAVLLSSYYRNRDLED